MTLETRSLTVSELMFSSMKKQKPKFWRNTDLTESIELLIRFSEISIPPKFGFLILPKKIVFLV